MAIQPGFPQVCPMARAIICATSMLPHVEASARVPRSQQSEAAHALLEGLRRRLAVSVETISHSRAAIAAAVGEGDGLSLGVDIEWVRKDRPFSALAGFAFGVMRSGWRPIEFYRTWTFHEAYFKAFQRVPPVADLRTVADFGNGCAIRQLSDEVRLQQLPVAGQFHLSLVWRAPMIDTCAPRFFLDPADLGGSDGS